MWAGVLVVKTLRDPFDLTIAVAPEFLDYIRHEKVEIQKQLMLTMRAFLRKAFRRTLRFFRFKCTAALLLAEPSFLCKSLRHF